MRMSKAAAMLMLVSAMLLGGCIGAQIDADPGGSDPGGEASTARNGTQNESIGEIQALSASWTAGVSGCPNIIFLGATDGVDSAWASIPPEAQGQAFTARYDSAVPAALYGITFWVGEEPAGFFESMEPEIEDNVPVETDEAIFWSCGGLDVTLEFLVTAAE